MATIDIPPASPVIAHQLMQSEVTEESYHRLLGVQIGHICRSSNPSAPPSERHWGPRHTLQDTLEMTTSGHAGPRTPGDDDFTSAAETKPVPNFQRSELCCGAVCQPCSVCKYGRCRDNKTVVGKLTSCTAYMLIVVLIPASCSCA